MASVSFVINWDETTHAQPRQAIVGHLPFLNRLRFHAQACRSSARLDLTEACALISHRKDTSLDGYARVLVQVCNQAVERPMRFFPVGQSEYSFDERWLIQLLSCAVSRDYASVQFLLRCRVAPAKHHAFKTVLMGIAGLLRG